LFALCQGTKAGIFKFCKAHEERICILLHDFRVIRADAAAEGDTYINRDFGGFLAESTKGEKYMRAMKVNMQFLDHHSLCQDYFTAQHSFLNLWFRNIPTLLSFNVCPSLVDGDEQQIATRVPAML
jgi:hypothetical protein